MQNVGIGKVETKGNLKKYFPEKYGWLQENSIEITNSVLGENTYFKIYELIEE